MSDTLAEARIGKLDTPQYLLQQMRAVVMACHAVAQHQQKRRLRVHRLQQLAELAIQAVIIRLIGSPPIWRCIAASKRGWAVS